MKGFLNIENICNVIHFDKSLFIIQMLTQMQANVFANWNFYHEMGSQSVIDLLWKLHKLSRYSLLNICQFFFPPWEKETNFNKEKYLITVSNSIADT